MRKGGATAERGCSREERHGSVNGPSVHTGSVRLTSDP